jgi:hypothetical protein
MRSCAFNPDAFLERFPRPEGSFNRQYALRFNALCGAMGFVKAYLNLAYGCTYIHSASPCTLVWENYMPTYALACIHIGNDGEETPWFYRGVLAHAPPKKVFIRLFEACSRSMAVPFQLEPYGKRWRKPGPRCL